jgi:dihydrolipoamide dehydrogenase
MMTFEHPGRDRPGEGLRFTVVGGGPAGYVAAIRASQLGADVTLIEKRQVGGMFLSGGCLPAKSLSAAARSILVIKQAERLGVSVQGARFDLTSARRSWLEAVRGSVARVLDLLRANGVRLLPGEARFVSSDRLEVTTTDGGEKDVPFDRLVIAVGASPRRPDIPGAEHPSVSLISESFLGDALPKQVCVLGGGMEACEAASILSTLGSEVSLLAPDKTLLPGEDVDISTALSASLVGHGVAVYTDTTPLEFVDGDDGGIRVRTQAPDGHAEYDAEIALIADERVPNLSSLDIETAGLVEENGRLIVDPGMQTNLPGVFAAGDCTGAPMLAHAASAEGEVAAENACGGTRALGYRTVPRCVFSIPEVGSVGLTEKTALKRGIAIRVSKFPFRGTARAMVERDSEGFVKIVADASFGSILGVHIIGPRATELIAEATLAVRKGMSASDLVDVVHAYPTLPEALREAALILEGRPLHSNPITASIVEQVGFPRDAEDEVDMGKTTTDRRRNA